MAKKLKINEQQLEALTNYIIESENRVNLTEENIIEEGMMDWAKMGLITLALLAGVKDLSAQDVPKDLNSDHMKAAQLVQQKIEQGDSTILSYFDAATIENNQENLEKLANVDNEDVEIFKTKYASTAKSKINKDGYALAGMEITSDTTWNQIPAPALIDSTVEMSFDGNTFITADFELNPDVKAEIDNLIAGAEALNGDISIISVYGTTDKEPIKVDGGLWNIGIKTNKQLAEARADAIVKYLESKGLQVNPGSIQTMPELGGDVYSSTMGDREDVRGSQTKYRGSGLKAKIINKAPAGAESAKAYEVTNHVKYTLIKKKDKGDTSVTKIKGGGTHKKFQCKIDISKGKTKSGGKTSKWLPCPDF